MDAEGQPSMVNLEYVSTRKKRFAHLRRVGEANTLCGASPRYYEGCNLIVIPEERAMEMHRCKKCFPGG